MIVRTLYSVVAVLVTAIMLGLFTAALVAVLALYIIDVYKRAW